MRHVLLGLLAITCAAFTIGFTPEPPEEAATAGVPKQGDKITNSLGMEFIYIEPGRFMMGSPAGEPHRQDDEQQHAVILAKGYWLGTTEVTQAQWNALMGPNLCYYKGDKLPIETVTWFDAALFCKRLGKKEEKAYRLPTEAEWEFACRAGTTTAFSFGDVITTDQVNFDGRVNTYGVDEPGEFKHTITAVRTYPANPWGFYDMHGNVEEWCSDWYGPYDAEEVTIDPAGPDAGKERVLRGGSWLDYQKYARSGKRNKNRPSTSHYSYGFRVVMQP